MEAEAIRMGTQNGVIGTTAAWGRIEPAAIDIAVRRLQERKHDWALLPLSEKLHHLEQMRLNVVRLAEDWVKRSASMAGLPANSPWLGELWMGGPWALLWGIDRYRETLGALAGGTDPLALTAGIRTTSSGQQAVSVFPLHPIDHLLISGVRAEVWMQPDVTRSALSQTMAGFYRQKQPQGKVTLVLAAGNVSSIAPMDMLHKLLAEGSVCLMKMNPVNDGVGPILEEIFAPLRAYGFVDFVYGGPDVGKYLVAHPGIDEIHMTGSIHTHDAIVFGSGPEGAARKAANQPRLDKPISSELGNVTPTIVVPGPWTEEDLRFQAESIATQKLHNGGFNCVGCQVLVTPAAWALTDQLLYHLRGVMRAQPARHPYYPGAEERKEQAACHPNAERLGDRPGDPVLITGLDPNAAEAAFREEFFCAALAETRLPGSNLADFLRRAVVFCNERLWGTLAANLIIHPATLARHRPAFEQALADLRYGSIAVNIWAGAGFMLSQTTWGGYPGHTLDNAGSGIGQVHNTFLFDRAQKSVVYGDFAPFPKNLRPRYLLHGERHILPKPPWFVTNRQGAATARQLFYYTADQKAWRLPGLFWHALRR
ncbi:MAG: aldehyde dehydrogenase family protein [Caldilineaceae bacterium]|nr:aldehyde dehydrogenase family protein [Caldilineaceae bacterium]HRJ42668.1 aldehyde dehydrogenase family protein [Caldilineaceae bacterium]